MALFCCLFLDSTMLWSFLLLIYDMYITYLHKSSKKDYQKKEKEKSNVAWNGKIEKKN